MSSTHGEIRRIEPPLTSGISVHAEVEFFRERLHAVMGIPQELLAMSDARVRSHGPGSRRKPADWYQQLERIIKAAKPGTSMAYEICRQVAFVNAREARIILLRMEKCGILAWDDRQARWTRTEMEA